MRLLAKRYRAAIALGKDGPPPGSLRLEMAPPARTSSKNAAQKGLSPKLERSQDSHLPHAHY
jgi:hypothetical protein